jgi:exopolyphosphatase/guanosine-5'-triphosphate,3'-diphosphate pyrophosphatase
MTTTLNGGRSAFPFSMGPRRVRWPVGVIDIGSNSVRMVVFDGAARSPAYFFNEKILCGLGAGFPKRDA